MKKILLFIILALPLQVSANTRIVSLFVAINAATVEADTFIEETEVLYKHFTDHFKHQMVTHKLYGEQATKENFLKEIEKIKASLTKEDVFFLYISSHGCKDEEGFRSFLKDSSIKGKEIINALKNITNNMIVMIDTCYSGAFADEWHLGNKIFIITTTNNNESSWTWHTTMHILTFKGKTLSELMKHLKENVTGQTPQFIYNFDLEIFK